MNLASVLNITAPAGAVIQNSNAAEGSVGFDALMETVSTPDAATQATAPVASPKTEALPETQSPINALVALLDSGEAAARKLPVTATAAALPATVAATGLAAEPEAPAPQPQPTMDAPPAVRDLALRSSAKMAKEEAADTGKPRTAEPGKGLASVKQDIKPLNTPVAVAVSKDLIKQVDESEEEPAEPENAAPSTDAKSDISINIQLVMASKAVAPAPQQAEALSRPDAAPDRLRPAAGTDGSKASQASAELTTPAKAPQIELSSPAFTMPSPTPSVISTSSMTAPVFGIPDGITTHQLDLARDTQWIDQLARDIVAVAGQDGKLRFGLSPSNLGQLEVSVETQQDGVNIQMQASTEAAARIFQTEQPKLVEELRQSGVRVTNSDLMGGQQMQGQRDQSRSQNPAGQAQANLTSGIGPKRTSPNNPNTSPSGRFA